MSEDSKVQQRFTFTRKQLKAAAKEIWLRHTPLPVSHIDQYVEIIISHAPADAPRMERCSTCGSREPEIRLCVVENCGRSHEEEMNFSHLKVVCSDSFHHPSPSPVSEEAKGILCDQLEEVTLDSHLKHVEAFLQEMYATMIDPIEQPKMKVSEMCDLLLKTAREQREQLYARHCETRPTMTAPSVEPHVYANIDLEPISLLWSEYSGGEPFNLHACHFADYVHKRLSAGGNAMTEEKSGEMTADEFYHMNLDVPKFHPADKAQVFTFTDRVSAHNTAALRAGLVMSQTNLTALGDAARSHREKLEAELAQLRKDYAASQRESAIWEELAQKRGQRAEKAEADYAASQEKLTNLLRHEAGKDFDGGKNV